MSSPSLFPSRLSVEAATEEAKAALAQQVREGEIVVTPGRTRPLYFDGRFLTAADLTADQDYVRHRMADLGRSLGFGVVNGLRVSPAVVNARPGVHITAGHGITPSGELVALAAPGPHFVAFNDLDVQQRVELQLGLRSAPRPTTNTQRQRVGLYVLALRPVEYSANPVASYPTTLDGVRSVRDGDTIEAVAITLVPYTERSPANASAEQRRAQVAREVFFERSRDTALHDALPLAVLLFEGGRMVWLDEHLARREVGTESGLAVTLNPRPRAVLEAWYTQYRDQLSDVAASGPFLAAQVFSALPPVGPIPAASIEWEQGFDAGLRQSYFPAEADVEFSFVAEDELPVLVDEGLGLPPIDLRADEATLDHLSLVILAPVPRAQLEDIRRNLNSARRPIRLATPTRTAVRSPIASLVQLGGLRTPLISRPLGNLPGIPFIPSLPPLTPPADALDAAWKRAFEAALSVAQARHGGMFFYMRRRQLPYSSEVSGYTLRLSGTAAQLDTELLTRLKVDAAEAAFNAATNKSPLLARAELLNVLASPRLSISTTLASGVLGVSDLLRRSALVEVSQASKNAADGSVKHDDAVLISQRFGADRLGEGLQRVLAAEPKLQTAAVVQAIAASRVVPQIDRMAADLPDEGVSKLSAQLLKLAQANKPDDIAALVK
jgi:hypothetical protein